MKPFTESMRYEYPLSADSVVFDCGGYEGNFANIISGKYGCRVYVFEPVGRFFLNICDHVGHDPNSRVHVYSHGIGGRTRDEQFHVQNDSSGAFAGSADVETVSIRAIDQVLRLLDLTRVDLLKLNIEGMEYEVIERILELGIAEQFRNMQVQFHTCVPDYERRYAQIAEGLARTHWITYRAPFCWENWELQP